MNNTLRQYLNSKPVEGKFIPYVVATAEFANNLRFEIAQIKANGACRITDLMTRKTSYSHSVANAWKSIRYQAGLTFRYENTTTWPSRGYFERGAEQYAIGERA